MNTAELFVSCLQNEGVKYIFGVPGEENLDFVEALRKQDKIQFIATRHEQGAAFMADVYGRLTGRAGVCLATLGPGATNLITGVADANMDRAPVVAITGQGDARRKHKESHQYMDVVKAFEPITKWNTDIVHPDTVPEIVRKAFRIAEMEKKGATHIELSEAVAKKEVKNGATKPLPAGPPPVYQASKQFYDKAAKLINESKKVIILAGNGIIRGRASKQLVQFAEKGGFSVANTFMAKGVMPARHELFISTIGLQAKDFVGCGFDQADLIITVGYDLIEYGPQFWNPNRDKKIIHIDSEPAEVDASYATEVELIGDIGTTLSELGEFIDNKQDFSYLDKLKELAKAEYRIQKESSDFPVKPQKLIYDLRHVLDDEDIVISDVGMHKIWTARQYPAQAPNTVIISNGFASMGISLPGAIAAKLVYPERKVVSICGDAGFLFNSQELETAKRLGTNFVVVIFNDSKYGMIVWKQMNHFGAEFGTSFNNPDFVKYAESFGCVGMRVEKTEDLRPTLEKAVQIDNVVIVDVPVDYSENIELSNKLGELVCPI